MVKLTWVCACGHKHDVARQFAGRTVDGRKLPEPGDVLMCIGCGEPFAFRDEADPVKLPWSVLVQLFTGKPERLRSFTQTRALIRGMN